MILDYLRRKLTGDNILIKSSEYNLPHGLEKKSLRKLLKYCKSPLTSPWPIYGQITRSIGVHYGEEVKKGDLERNALQFVIF